MFPKKRRVSFWATKKIPKKATVSFRDSSGRRVSFTATKRVPKKVKVNFWASKSGKPIRRRR